MTTLHKKILLAVLSLITVGVIAYKTNLTKSEDVVSTPPINHPIQEAIPEKQVPTYESVIAEISEEKLKKDLYYLASDQLEGRMSGKKGNVEAAKFVKEEFEKAGLNTEYQKFNIARRNPGPNNETGDDFTQNVIGWIDGTEITDEIVVIGAHMDHIGYGPSMSRSRKIKIHPGADDNASGTVALIEMAKAFAILKPKRTTVFIAFSAEEMGLIGSRYYCDNPIFPKNNPSIKKHIFMLNMDMIGYLRDGSHQVSWSEAESSVDVAGIIAELSNKYSFARRITSRGSGGSDHACFYNKKVPIAFLHTGLHAHYHTPEDTPDKINYSGLTKITKYGFELGWKVANSENKPRFNNTNFKEMPYDHDHGHIEFK